MKNLLHIHITIFCLALLFTACKNSDSSSVLATYSTSAVKIIYPEISAQMEVGVETLVFTNKSSGEVISVKKGDDVTLLTGLYDCDYNATVTIDGDEASIYGMESSIIVKNSLDVTIQSYLITEADDFIIEEIFFTGTLQPSGKTYRGDNYVKLYNPTDHVLYADGVALTESKFTSSQKIDCTPDIRMDTMTIQALYVVPGNGTEHPVEPGESFLICDIGIDHRVANPNSFDLSNADMEWYDESSSAANMDIDSETVPNLDKWYCYTQSIWILHSRGLKSYAIARIPETKEDYLDKFYYTYDYVLHLEAGDFYMSQSAYKLPNSWILDGVNCSVEAVRQWNILPPAVDAGWTHCGYIDKDESRYSKSVRRKVLGFDSEGRRILKDTNNSTNDFNTECIPSLMEEQGL